VQEWGLSCPLRLAPSSEWQRGRKLKKMMQSLARRPMPQQPETLTMRRALLPSPVRLLRRPWLLCLWA